MPTLTELRTAREQAGANVIRLRDQSAAADFVPSAEFDANWTAANEAYNSAQRAEETELQAEAVRRERDETVNRIQAEATRLDAAARDRLRPDYDPRRDPRSRGASTEPSRQDWGRALRCWAAMRSPSYYPEDEDLAAARRCRVNLHANEMILPSGSLHDRVIRAAQSVFRNTHPSQVDGRLHEVLAALNTGDPEGGGYIAEPPQILRTVEVNMLAFGGLLQIADTITTPTGEDIKLPTANDTQNTGRRIGENASLGTTVNPTVGLIKWGAHKYTSDVMSVTYEMLRDSWYDLETYLGERGGERLGRIGNSECTTGTGNSMPHGIVTAAEIGKTTASSTVITTDDIVDLEHSVDLAYRGGASFMCHDGIIAHLRKAKDGEGRPLYALGQETGGKDRLNNYPVNINLAMASSLAAGAYPLLFGQMNKYRVRRVGGFRLVRDPYTQRMSNDLDLFAVLMYLDGNLVNSGTCPVKKLRMKP